MKTIYRFLRYQGKIVLLSLILVLGVAAITWRTFFHDTPEDRMRRDFLVEDISVHSGIHPERLAQYSDQELEIISRLDLNGIQALELHREATLRLYQELKDFQIFYEVIEAFGPHHVIPALDYFYESGNLSLTLEQAAAKFIAELFNQPVEEDTVLTERQKRLLAILGEIQYQQHNFLARFIYTKDGARRNYVATTTSAISNFFTGGLSHLNAALVTRGVADLSREELIDAGIDVLVLVPFAGWLGRSSKAATGTARGARAATALKASRYSTFAAGARGFWRAIPVRTLFRFKYVKWYALALAVIKPDLINHAASLVARVLGISPLVLKTGFWLLILLPILNLLIPMILFLRFFWRKVLFRRKYALAR